MSHYVKYYFWYLINPQYRSLCLSLWVRLKYQIELEINHAFSLNMLRARALRWWLAPVPFTLEFGVGSRSRRFERNKMFLPHPRVKHSILESLRDREVACSVSDRQGSSFESCVWRTVSSHSSHHDQEVLLAQFSLYVHKGGLKTYSFHFI